MQFDQINVPGGRDRQYDRRRLSRLVPVKRAFDLVGLSVLAPLALPLIGLLWLAVRRDGGPGFFGHRRVGRDGVEFTCWKLRTMVPDAERALQAHLRSDRAAALEWANTYKLAKDPRVTRLGRVLRKTSLDELPQLWNVFRGDMSLVGPRPVPRAELVEYEGNLLAYLALRPGMTGLWQVSGRNAVSYADRVAMDADYAMNANLLLDLRILGKTVGVVLRKTGV